jgi:hypothetical protein
MAQVKKRKTAGGEGRWDVMTRISKHIATHTPKAVKRGVRAVFAQVVPFFTRERLIAEAFSRDLSPCDVYGPFDTELYRHLDITGLSKESNRIRGEIVACLRSVRWEPPVLLPGEYNRDRDAYADLLNTSRIVTAGIGTDHDHQWNFEDDPPTGLDQFGLIVSQAMLEHLIDPYKHVRDCAKLLDADGVAVFHTPSPGFQYHRHPVDCQRFYPDWFEEVAIRLDLRIEYRYFADLRVMYALRHQ